MFLNSVFILFGLIAVLVLDRDIPYKTYLLALYIFLLLIFSSFAGFISMIAFFNIHFIFYSLFFGTIALAGLYLFFPQLLKRSLAINYIPLGIWHTRNSLLALSWIIVVFLLYFLFRGQDDVRDIIVMSLVVLIVFWSWIYIHTDRSPVFFV